MPIGTTIDGLNAVTSLTTNDEVAVWDKEATGEPTKKITGQNLANSVKGLMPFDTTPTTGSTNLVTSGGIATAIAQSTANAIRHTVSATTNGSGVVFTDIPISTKAWGFATLTYPCQTGYYQDKYFLLVTNSVNGSVVPLANASVTYIYYTFEYGT